MAAVLDRHVLGGTLSSLDVARRLPPVVPAVGSSPVGTANPAGPDGPVVAGGHIGPCGTLSPLLHKVLGSLEHSALDHAGPAGQHVAVGPVGPLRTLSPSDCHPAGLAGPAGPAGPACPGWPGWPGWPSWPVCISSQKVFHII